MHIRFGLACSSILLSFASISFGGEVPVAGRVVGPRGTPFADAEVMLLPILGPVQEAHLAESGTLPKAESRAVTDAEGRYRLGAPHAGLFRVRVQAPGFVPIEMGLEPLIEPVDLTDAELVADAGLTVQVRGRDGKPLTGARMRLAAPAGGPRFGGGQSLSWQLAPRTGVSDETGKARLARSEKEPSVLTVSAPGYVLQEKRNVRGTAVTVALQQGTARTLRLVTPEGAPVAGALVLARSFSQSLGYTDAEGRSEIFLAAGGSLPIALVADDGRRVEGSVAAVSGAQAAGPGASNRKGQPAPRPPARLFTLPAGVTVKGRLIDARSRAAISGGLVWIDNALWGASVTDAAGNFTLRGSGGAADVDIFAGAPGYLRPDPAPYAPGAKGSPGPTLALKPAAAIEGVIVDEAGGAIAGAEARLEERQGNGDMMIIRMGAEAPASRAVSSSHGSFRLSPIDPEKNYDLKVVAKGFASATREILGLEPQRTMSGVRVALSAGQAVLGQVVDGEGKPIREAEVILKPTRRNRQGPGGGMIMLGGAPGGMSESFKGTTEEDGHFRIAGLGTGLFDLEVKRQGFARKTMDSVDVPKRDTALDLGKVVMEPGLRFQGIVNDPDGNPIEGVEITLAPGGGGGPMMMFGGPRNPAPPVTITGPEGRFSLEDLRQGEKLNLGFNRSGYVSTNESSVEVPQPDLLKITMQPASKISGRVLGKDNKPVAGATVNLTRTQGGGIGGQVIKMIMRNSTTADDEGHYLFENVRPGQIALSAVAPGWQEVKLDGVEVPQGKDVEDMDLPLKPGAVVTGRVLAPDGRPVIGARVGIVTDDPEPIRIDGATSDGDGYYRLDGIAPGTVSIEATHDAYVRTVKEIDARPGANTLGLQFGGGQDIAGLVTDAAGAPVLGAYIQLTPAGNGWGGPEANTARDGAFKMTGVGDGDYEVNASREGFAPSRGEVKVHVAGKPIPDLKVVLREGASIAGTVKGIEADKLPQVNIRAWNTGGGGSASASPNREGAYSLKDLGPGNWTVTAALAATGQETRGELVLEPGTTEGRLDLQFGLGLTLSGQAMQGDQPVKAAVLFARGTDVNHSAWGRTGFDGGFRIEGLEPGKYRIELRQWETGLFYDESIDLPASREIVLKVPTARIVGRVLDGADQKGIAGVGISLAPSGTDAERASPMAGRGATTDLTGHFEIANVPGGSWILTANKAGYAAGSLDVNIENGRDVGDARLTLDATEGLSLDVHLASGRTPDSIEVAVFDAGGRSISAGSFATGENGRVRLSRIPAGSWNLLVSAGGSGTLELGVQVPGPPLAVTLPPACSLKVKVPDLAGTSSAATATVQSSDGRKFQSVEWAGETMSQWRLAGGQLQLDTLPPGSWTVQVAASDGRTWSGAATTAPGIPTEVVLR